MGHGVTLYAVQKFLFQLNRSEALQQAYLADPRGELAGYELDRGGDRGRWSSPTSGSSSTSA